MQHSNWFTSGVGAVKWGIGAAALQSRSVGKSGCASFVSSDALVHVPCSEQEEQEVQEQEVPRVRRAGLWWSRGGSRLWRGHDAAQTRYVDVTSAANTKPAREFVRWRERRNLFRCHLRMWVLIGTAAAEIKRDFTTHRVYRVFYWINCN